MRTTTFSFCSIPFLFGFLSHAASNIDCKQPIRVEKTSYDFSKLDDPRSIWSIDESRPPAVYNTTWTVSLCKPLKVEDSKKKDQCPSGTNICGVVRSYNPVDDPDHKHDELENVIPVAGSYTHDTGKQPEPKWSVLDAEDDDAKGIQLDIKGGTYGKINQKAVIKFLCHKKESKDERRRDKDDEEHDDEDEKDKKKKKAKDEELKFESYATENVDGKIFEVLRMTWKTPYACEGYEDSKPSGSSGWGFFTWFIVILFLGIAAYLIFGSWLNYNRYGARGWDLLPHGDTIRDIPYLVKDWGRKVVDTVSGPGSRGGYSAV